MPKLKIYANHDIKKGKKIDENDLTDNPFVVGVRLCSINLVYTVPKKSNIIGKFAKQNIKKGTRIDKTMLESKRTKKNRVLEVKKRIKLKNEIENNIWL